jgi:hypothetical protein
MNTQLDNNCKLPKNLNFKNQINNRRNYLQEENLPQKVA